MEPVEGDALGLAMLEYLEMGQGWHVVERDDGRAEVLDTGVFFAEPGDWPEGEPEALGHVCGRVLDVGAGAGRYAVELLRLGHEVVALDVSPGAVEVCRRRRIEHGFVGTVYELTDEETFDTFVLAGHNLALLAGPEEATRFLRRLGDLARPGARIVGTNRDPYGTTDPDHLAYHRLNRSRGRVAGQLRLRIRHQRTATPWFDYWFLSPSELEATAAPVGWWTASLEPLGSGSYLAVLERARG